MQGPSNWQTKFRLPVNGRREAMAVSLKKQALETEKAASQAKEPGLQKGPNTTRKPAMTGAVRRLNAGKDAAASGHKGKAAAATRSKARAENRRQAGKD